MAKGVLIIDIPPVCGNCIMYRYNWFKGGECTCRITGDRVELNDKADTCPLRELPEKANHPDYCDNGRFDKGWNACLDEIESII